MKKLNQAIKLKLTTKLIILLFLHGNWAVSQDTISVDFVNKHTYSFNITEKGITGSGGDFLKKEFKESQFVLIGEHHSDARVSQFTNAIIPELAEVNYKYFCLETGPNSTEILERISRDSDIENSMSSLYTNYFKKVKGIPIPFFEGKEDIAFLKTAINHNFKLFGIDQEYYSSTLILIDELLSLDRNNNTISTHQLAADFVIKAQLNECKLDDYEMHQEFLNSKELSNFFNSLDTTISEVRKIIKDLRFSWEVYALYYSNRNKNLELRADYMKKQFVSSYKKFASKDSLPKVLLKMGSAHTQRGITYNSVYDIGNFINELSNFNGTKNLNIRFLFRFIEDKEEAEGLFDNSIGNSEWLKQRRPLLLQGQKESWVVIDLRSMKEAIINREVWSYPAIRQLIYNTDLIVIPPTTYNVTPHYKEL